MSHDSSLDPALLARYFMGECTHAEATAFEHWVAADPERERIVTELREVWQLERRTEHFATPAAWASVAARRARHGSGAPLRLERGLHAGSARPFLRSLAIAASLALALGGGLWLSLGKPFSASPQYASYSTEYGQRRAVTLGDGSRVTLGPSTALRVVVTGADAHRQVELTGQAFFQVAHDVRRPFRVYARGAEARVLGTEFIVRAYADEPDVQVAVRSGRVAVRNDTTATPSVEGPVVTAGHRARLVRGRTVRLERLVDSTAFAWVTGPLRFESTPLGEVAAEMGRWIGIEMTVADSAFASTRVTMMFPDVSRDSVIARLGRVAGSPPLRVGRRLVFRASQ